MSLCYLNDDSSGIFKFQGNKHKISWESQNVVSNLNRYLKVNVRIPKRLFKCSSSIKKKQTSNFMWELQNINYQLVHVV